MRFAICFCAAACFAQTIDRSKPPETPPLQPYNLPAVRESKLTNGLAVLLVEDKRFPLVTLRLAFRAGSRFDPASRYGVAETLASLLKAGTTTRSARQIAEELAAIGGSINAGETADSLTISASVLAEHTGKLLDLTADVVRSASFPQQEIDLRKQNRVQELSLQRSQSNVLADEKLRAVVFGNHPYARTLPTPQSIRAITRQDLIAFRDRLLTPGNAVLVLVGALPPEKQMLEMVGARFGSWPAKPVPDVPASDLPKPERSITLIDRPGSAQVDILIGHITVNRQHADYFPVLVGANILGGGASSRLFNNIREKQGFAYQANSHNMPFKDTGIHNVVTQVREEVVEPAMKAVFAELTRMGTEPVTAQELTDRKNYLNGIFVMQISNQDGVASQLASLRMNGMPEEYLEKYVTNIRSVEPDQIQRVGAKYFSPEDAAIVVVGDASKIAEEVRKFGKVTIEKAQ
ncbi:MAG TPA: pitrilysin family protein [Bryobacteraceae bacterium]|nr:pitrilysin family protein [Bryobacteraceae bacterium]